MKKARGRSGFLAVCIAPAVILFFVFMILPTLNVFRMSLFEKGAYSPNETFVGLKNFKTLISDTNFIRSCLLYTSPSPRDYAASRMPSSA